LRPPEVEGSVAVGARAADRGPEQEVVRQAAAPSRVGGAVLVDHRSVGGEEDRRCDWNGPVEDGEHVPATAVDEPPPEEAEEPLRLGRHAQAPPRLEVETVER